MAFAHVVLTSRGTVALQFITVSFQFSLIYNKCLPSLYYGLEACPIKKITY